MGKELETYKKCLEARRKRREAREGGKKCLESPDFFAPKFLFVDALSRTSSFPVSSWSYRVRLKA